MHVFLGITGASGAPYAERVLKALSDAGCDVGLAVSDAGIQVLGTELYGDGTLARADVLSRLVEGLDRVKAYDVKDYSAPYASGSAKVDGYLVCPCSMATAATIAAGAMANLIHRAASVALKEERKLVLVPRETPLSSIHLENLLKLRNAGADVIPAMPAFYHLPQSIDDMIAFVAGRCLAQLGLDTTLVKPWGDE